jgi:predicted transcriptional regulator
MRGLTANHVMTTEVLAVEADWSIERLSEFLIVKCISGAPVQSKEGNLIGVVSLSDIVRYDTQPEKDMTTIFIPWSAISHERKPHRFA